MDYTTGEQRLNTKGLPYNKELDDGLSKDASADLHSFLDNFDFRDQLYRDENIPDNESKFLSLNNCDVFKKSDDKNIYIIRKTNMKDKRIEVYQSLNLHTIGSYIVFPGTDEITYFNTLTHSVIIENLK